MGWIVPGGERLGIDSDGMESLDFGFLLKKPKKYVEEEAHLMI